MLSLFKDTSPCSHSIERSLWGATQMLCVNVSKVPIFYWINTPSLLLNTAPWNESFLLDAVENRSFLSNMGFFMWFFLEKLYAQGSSFYVFALKNWNLIKHHDTSKFLSIVQCYVHWFHLNNAIPNKLYKSKNKFAKNISILKWNPSFSDFCGNQKPQSFHLGEYGNQLGAPETLETWQEKKTKQLRERIVFEGLRMLNWMAKIG